VNKVALLVAGLLVSVSALGDNNVPAKYCEIFVDKVVAYHGAYSTPVITFFIKTLNTRLSASVEEVGFRSREFGFDESNTYTHGSWLDRKARPFVDSDDYWMVSLTGTMSFEGAFYVKTTDGMRYWVNPANGPNFVVQKDLFDRLIGSERQNAAESPNDAIPTQGTFLQNFNPKDCH
jgi:hypothetical protein